MVLRNLFRRKLRAALSIAGIAVSVAATVTLLGLSQGVIARITAVVSGPGGELTVVQRIPGGLTFGYLGTVPLSAADRIRTLPGVSAVNGADAATKKKTGAATAPATNSTTPARV